MEKQKVIDILGYIVVIVLAIESLSMSFAARLHVLSKGVAIIACAVLCALFITCIVRVYLYLKISPEKRRKYKVGFHDFETIICPYSQTIIVLFVLTSCIYVVCFS